MDQKTDQPYVASKGRPAGRGPNDLRPLPMRISQRTYERLTRLRDLDDMTIQEHVRRGLEYYLDHVEVSIALSASEALKSAVTSVKARHAESGENASALVPDLLARHAPRPVRPSAARIVSK